MRSALTTLAASLVVVAFSVSTAAASPASSGPALKKVHGPGHVTGTIHGHCSYRNHGQLPWSQPHGPEALPPG
jgi:Spy/CpxP family protein refolding chaperone